MIFFLSQDKNSSNFSLSKVKIIVFLIFLPFLPLLLLSLPLESFQSLLTYFLAWFKYFSGFALNLTLSLLSLGFSLSLGEFVLGFFFVCGFSFLPFQLVGKPPRARFLSP